MRAATATTISRSRSRAARCAPRWPKPSGRSEDNDMTDSNLGAPIGLPLDRVDGRLKVTGGARYAYEYAAQGAALYGVIVPAAVGKGRVAAVDVHDAQMAPGVRLVVTKDKAPAQ